MYRNYNLDVVELELDVEVLELDVGELELEVEKLDFRRTGTKIQMQRNNN